MEHRRPMVRYRLGDRNLGQRGNRLESSQLRFRGRKNAVRRGGYKGEGGRKSPTSASATTVLRFESLPTELISDILGETNIESVCRRILFAVVKY